MQFQNSNLKLLFRTVYQYYWDQYYWEENLSCQSSQNAFVHKKLRFIISFCISKHFCACVSVPSCWYCVLDILLIFFFLSGTYCWYCVLEVWVWGMSNNCGAIIVWVSGMAETSMESMDLTLQFLFLSQFHLWWWTLLICMHRP